MATITVAEHAGFCFGVKNALRIAEEELGKAGDGPVYCLGPLIHNKEVLRELKEELWSLLFQKQKDQRNPSSRKPLLSLLWWVCSWQNLP